MSESYRFGGQTHALSSWQAGSLRPWEVGVYERAGADGRYSCWDGIRWLRSARTPRDAASQTAVDVAPPTAWRGLAAPSGQRCLTCKGHSILDFGIHPDNADDWIVECPDC